MISNLVLASVLLLAPVPKGDKPVGPPPVLVEYKPNDQGKIIVTVLRESPVKRTVSRTVVVNGVQEVKTETVEVMVTTAASVELGEVSTLTMTTADGKEVDKATGMKKIREGAVVVLSADGEKVDPKYLKLFRDDTLVLASKELRAGRSFSYGRAPEPLEIRRALPAPVPPAPAPPVPAAGRVPVAVEEVAIPVEIEKKPPHGGQS
ncbi:MAG: hypothetical protein ACRC8S_07490 [Fimbriiglobus sp.]